MCNSSNKLGQPRYAARRRGIPTGLMLLVACHLSVQALEFTTRQIADDRYSNRDPILSDSGLAAWTQYNSNDIAGAITDLILWNAGERTSLGGENAANFYANAKPVLQGTSVAWVANYRKFAGTSWVLREVPTRDEGAAEIPALYKAAVTPGGSPLFINVAEMPGTNGTITVTNVTDGVTNLVESTVDVTNQVRRFPSGDSEINLWPGGGEIIRVTTDRRHDFAPSFWDRLVSWQKEKGFPFGWEIMVWDDGTTKQLTTNFYYDMAPRVYQRQVVWYGWDGYDFEIYLYNADSDTTVQITSNRFDDVGPVIWDNVIAWEGYPAVEADIFLYKDGQVTKISDNVEDDINPRVWNGQVVWQGFDGDDYEIYLYDGTKPIKVTGNDYDDTNPDIRDGLITWMGYVKNWDAEIMVWDGTGEPVQMTDNEEEDRDPKTAGRRVIWAVDRMGRSEIWLAEPK